MSNPMIKTPTADGDCGCDCGGCDYLFCGFYLYRERGTSEIMYVCGDHPGHTAPDADPFWDSIHMAHYMELYPDGNYPADWCAATEDPHWWASCWVPGDGQTIETDPPNSSPDEDPFGGNWSHDCDECGEIEGADVPEACDAIGGRDQPDGAPSVAELILHPLP